MLVERVSDLEQKNKDTEMNFDLLNQPIKIMGYNFYYTKKVLTE